MVAHRARAIRADCNSECGDALAPSQIGLEFWSVSIGRDRNADLDVVCSAARNVGGMTRAAAAHQRKPSQFELAFGLDQIFDAGVGVRLNHSLNPNEGAHGSGQPIGPAANNASCKAVHSLEKRQQNGVRLRRVASLASALPYMSSNSPSGGMKEMVRSTSKRARRTHLRA